jgi:dTDP-4-dehydrorhamnose 3,5-epimerase
MKRIATALPDVVLLEPAVYSDARGCFLEAYNARDFRKLAIDRQFVQDNQSHSVHGVLRGLHYQLQHPQAKLVRVVFGAVFDVAVDVRWGSPTFGHWVGTVLSGDNHRLLFIPEGFAHGFYVLSDTAEFVYKCSEFYCPADDRGLLWSDPALGIDWPLPPGTKPLLSDKDARHPGLDDIRRGELPRYREAAA